MQKKSPFAVAVFFLPGQPPDHEEKMGGVSSEKRNCAQSGPEKTNTPSLKAAKPRPALPKQAKTGEKRPFRARRGAPCRDGHCGGSTDGMEKAASETDSENRPVDTSRHPGIAP